MKITGTCPMFTDKPCIVTCCFLFLCISHVLNLSAQKQVNINLEKEFLKYGVEGCFVIYDEHKNTISRYNPQLCDSGYLPASTFKIPNAVIALEEGVVKDTNQVFPWNKHTWNLDSWNKDQNLKTAIQYSCIWVFFDIAEKVGVSTYEKYLSAFNYGNKDLSGTPTRFWLTGLLRITANQQVVFFEKILP